MRRLAIVLALAALTACAPKTNTVGATNAPPIENVTLGLWSGEAGESPLGRQPYAIIFRKKGAGLVAETPPTLGEEELPPGAFQRFEFPGGMQGPTATFNTSMGSAGYLNGDLKRDDRSTKSKAIFCEAGNCGSMELSWESTASDAITFQVRIDGKLHVDIRLKYDGEME